MVGFCVKENTCFVSKYVFKGKLLDTCGAMYFFLCDKH